MAITNLELWRLEPSVRNFSDLVGKPEWSQVNETLDAYVITYSATQVNGDNALLAAKLKLRKSDLRAQEQSLSLQQNGELLEYRFVEASFERWPIGAIAPKVFEPDAELFDDGGVTGRGERGTVPPSAHLSVSSSSLVASRELEVEIAFLLDQFRSRFGDQINLTRRSEGSLLVQAIVDTSETKAEMLRALSPVDKNPAVIIEISTAAELLERQQRNSGNQPVVQQFSGAYNRIPAYEELHRYFRQLASSQQGASIDDSTDEAIRMFATQAVGRSRRVLSHAIELRQLKERFSPGTLTALTSDAQNKYFGIIRNHAEAVRAETAILFKHLEPVFYGSKDLEIPKQSTDFSSNEELAMAIERLYRLAIANDEVIRSAFSASSKHPDSLQVKSPGFYVALGTVEDLAERIRRTASARQQ